MQVCQTLGSKMEAAECVLLYRFDSAWSWKGCCAQYWQLMSSLSFLCLYFSLEKQFQFFIPTFCNKAELRNICYKISRLWCLVCLHFIPQGQLQDLGRVQPYLLGWWAAAKFLQPQPYHRFSMTLCGKLLGNLWFKIQQTQPSNSPRFREVTEFLGCFMLAQAE